MTSTTEESFLKFDTDTQLLEIQGITLHTNKNHVLGIYALFSIFPTTLCYFWPSAGWMFLVILWYSIIQDSRAKQGWVRSLLLKSCGKNIISWFPERLPQQENSAPKSEATIIFALAQNNFGKQKNISISLIVLALVVSYSTWFTRENTTLLLWITGVLSILTLICFALPPVHRDKKDNLHTIHNLLYSSWHEQKRQHRFGILLYEDGFNGGGLSTFLQNYSDFIPPTHSRIVFLEEADTQQIFIPQGLFGTPSIPSPLKESPLLVSATSQEHSMYSAYAHGWGAFLVQTPMTPNALHTLCTNIDTLPISQ